VGGEWVLFLEEGAGENRVKRGDRSGPKPSRGHKKREIVERQQEKGKVRRFSPVVRDFDIREKRKNMRKKESRIIEPSPYEGRGKGP